MHDATPTDAAARAADTDRRLAAASREFAEAGSDRARILDALVRAVARPGDACAVLRPMAGKALERVAGDPVVTGPFGQVDTAAVGADGRRAVAPLRAGGRELGVVAWSRGPAAPDLDRDDLTLLQELADRAALALAGAERIERLEAALDGRDELLAGVAHELRNPLGVITINGSLLQRWATPDADGERIRGAADKIQRAARRMNEHLAEALDAVKAERGALQIEPTAHVVAALLARAVEAATPAAAQRRVELAALTVDPDLRATCDDARVVQAITILVERALRTLPPAGRLTLAAARAGALVRVDLVDTTARADADDGAFVDACGSPGARLRLALVRGIVEAHGGTLTLAPGVFSFTLPALRDARTT